MLVAISCDLWKLFRESSVVWLGSGLAYCEAG